jgi:hypothetical protein
MNDFRLELLEIAERLAKLAGGAVSGGGEVDGMIAVEPEGVLGQGKVRNWPVAIEVQRMDGSRGIELCWSYALRLSYVRRPDGEMYVPRILRDGIGAWMQKVAPPPEQAWLYPATVDRWVYPEDWMSQAEIDAKLASDQQWAEDYHRKYGV